MKNQLFIKVAMLIFCFLVVACGPLPTPVLPTPTLPTATLSTELPAITPTFTIPPPPTLTLTPDPFIEITAIFQETETAKQRNTAVFQVTEAAGATATQHYVEVLQTVQAEMEATRIYEEAQQQIATQQAGEAMATAQSIIVFQQTATAIAEEQSKRDLVSMMDKLADFPIAFTDTFDDDSNGWSPKKGNGYDVTIQNGVFQVNYSDEKYTPFLWTCDKCGTFNNFSFQVDIQTPKNVRGVVAGIVFGSPTRIDQQPFKEAYALSLYSTGAFLLQRISYSRIDTIRLWDKRQDLLTPDGEFHTLQIIVVDKHAIVYIDGKIVGDVVSLENSGAGYIGIVTQTPNVNILYDNMQIIELP